MAGERGTSARDPLGIDGGEAARVRRYSTGPETILRKLASQSIRAAYCLGSSIRENGSSRLDTLDDSFHPRYCPNEGHQVASGKVEIP